MKGHKDKEAREYNRPIFKKIRELKEDLDILERDLREKRKFADEIMTPEEREIRSSHLEEIIRLEQQLRRSLTLKKESRNFAESLTYINEFPGIVDKFYNNFENEKLIIKTFESTLIDNKFLKILEEHIRRTIDHINFISQEKQFLYDTGKHK